MTDPRSPGPTMVDAEDVDDVVELAARRQDEERQQLTVAEVESIGADVGLKGEHVRDAVVELTRSRERARALAEETAASRRLLVRRVAVGSFALAGVCLALSGVGLVLAVIGRGALVDALADVEFARAAVSNVIDHRERVHRQWDTAPDGPDREAELAGADNRVRIERRRYDVAATRYNASANGIAGSLACSIFDVPCRVPLSIEARAW